MQKTSVVQRKRHAHQTKRTVRRALPFLASLFLATPLAGPVNKSMAGEAVAAARPAATPEAVSRPLSKAEKFSQKLHGIYASLGVEEQGLRFEVFEKAMTGYLNLRQAGKLDAGKQVLSVVDFDLPSSEKRLWVLDLTNHKVLFNTLVAHGRNSGENEATNFSNTNESNMSSLGFYATSGEYEGKHGHSLRLQGLDEGYNNNAAARSIVMHGADYVSADFVKRYGRLGRSLGCPALPMDQYSQIIDAVTGGTCLFLNKSGANYSSRYLNQEAAIAALVSNAASVS